MAKTVIINGVTYSDVERVKLPLADNPGTLAEFPDTSDADAAQTDLKKGKTAYVNGQKITGTKTDASFSLTEGVLSIS